MSPFASYAAHLLTRRGLLRAPLRPHATVLLASAIWCARSAAGYRAQGRRVPDLPDDATLARAAARQAREDAACGYRVLA